MNIIKPQYVGGVATLYWGFQGDLLQFAIPMALLLEARYFFNRRWALTKTDFYRVADLTSLGLVAIVIFLFQNAKEYHFITTLLMWLPILFFPLVIVLAYSTTPRMPLDVLFYSLRRQKEPIQHFWDMDYVFLGMCLLAAGLSRSGMYYFPIVAVIIFYSLYKLRSPRFHLNIFLLSMSLVFVTATALHTGMRGAHLELKEKTGQWIAQWLRQRTDPLKTNTLLGHIGQLKLSDAIAFRIEPDSARPDFPVYLQEAVYNHPGVNNWGLFESRFDLVAPSSDFNWRFAPPSIDRLDHPEATIYLTFERDGALIPLPAELAEVSQLPALELRQSGYGTIQATGLVPTPFYKVRYQANSILGDTPTAVDLIIPEQYQPMLEEIAPRRLAPRDAIDFTQRFFSDFRYTLFQQGDNVNRDDIEINPLIHFMTQSQAGHCEYFAGATALLLRQLGVPARYVVGYSVTEWNSGMNMYIVRKRHAHAWTVAFVDGAWIVIDTTPSVWLGEEENRASLLQPLWDFVDNNQFLLVRWWNSQKLEDYEVELYILGFLLVLILIWRIATSEQVIIGGTDTKTTKTYKIPGIESPFFQIETHLAGLGLGRGTSELMSTWLIRIDRRELLPLLGYHNRWRFDPKGVSEDEIQALRNQVSQWLNHNSVDDQ